MCCERIAFEHLREASVPIRISKAPGHAVFNPYSTVSALKHARLIHLSLIMTIITQITTDLSTQLRPESKAGSLLLAKLAKD